MSTQNPTEVSSSRNLKRLFVLRNLMVGGELIALLTVNYLIGIPLPLNPLSSIIGTLALINLWTWHRIRSGAFIHDKEFLIQLAIDVTALTGVLYFTGGATNPFAWIFLIPLIIAATVLSAKATWMMATLTITCYTLLMIFFLPLPGQEHMHHSANFSQHVFGMWFGFILSAVLISWSVVGMARTLRERDHLLGEVRERALRDEQLVAMGTLATGAAHELGTPLATMAVVTRELERQETSTAVKRKARIMRDQIDRCKRALSIISASAGEAQAESGSLINVDKFLTGIMAQWKDLHPGVAIETEIQDGPASATIVDEYTLHQSLFNLLNNAAEVSADSLLLKADWDEKQLIIDILDRGPGLHPSLHSQLDQHKPSRKEFGMGLGLFLTHATIRRLGGNIALFDRDGGGTSTRIKLPLTNFPNNNE